MKLAELVEVSSAVAATSGRLEKISRLAALLSRLTSEEVPIAIGFLVGWPRQGKIGIGWSTISSARGGAAAATPSLELLDVDAAFSALTKVRGKNSAGERARLLGELFSLATQGEQIFLGALLVGEVRQGALEGVMLEAVAKASGLPSDKVRRAAMMAGDLGTVAQAALGDDREAALAKYQLEVFRPVQPMLADSAPDISEAFGEGGTFAVEWKLDGARIQVHKRDDRVGVYTRSLNEVTNAVPEVVATVQALPARDLILDGEVISLAADGRPLSFQDTMRRFGRRINVEKLRDELPLTPFFFDLLLHDTESMIDHPLSQRLERLDDIASSTLRVPRIVTADVNEAQKFQADALARGHEGVMVKLLSAPYAAGRRGSAWIKVKTARTLDLVVLAVEWGSGRRQGWLSNIHLGARDPATGGFVMLGKTFKGMTDEMLEWQTKEFLEREVSREGHIVHVRPELVVEVAFNEVQKSPHYPGGVALRFARVKGYRPDKKPSEADTIDAVRAYLPEGQR
ncbi:MAG TPA: ATP-dependent DNA ligase [Gemmatimonadaceae bacterium]|nr:ATP-dependent DNA ligase [Gemmatimonadaceae bacterium]